MNPKQALATVLLISFLAPPTDGQSPPHLPATGPTPLLYIRFAAPAALEVTFHQGTPSGKSLATPVTVGLRPGYIYRVRLTKLPEHPGLELFPTLEVRGTLQLPPQIRALEHPVPLVFTEDDVTQAIAGSFITKVVYLEDPERALAVATQPDRPLETELRPGEDLLAEARSLGRPMLIIRLGGRTFIPEEMARKSVPGTVLFPGDKALSTPPVPPNLPWACLPLYDPYLGPRPAEEECLHDGGIAGPAPGFDRQGRLHGLKPSDTVAEYKDSQGRPQLAPSNRVCICAPRFAVLRTMIRPIGYEASVALGSAGTALTESMVLTRLPSLEARQSVPPEALSGRKRTSAVENSQATLAFAQLEAGGLVVGRIHQEAIVGALLEKACPPPERPLILCKTVDKPSAQVGDVVTFLLKYTNQGGQPITDVVVSDSLTGRLEYVPESAKTDRQAVLTTQLNEAGSLVLRWQIGGPLLPGQSGLITFQARIR
jgi:uncharacterized repeat protein (TIGR01451 family)